MTDVLAYEELDVSCEQLALTRIEETLELLDCKLTQISVEGRISRAEASALVERYAVQFDERYPLASFTQSPSSTNLTVAQEGVARTAGRYLLDLIKRAGEMMKKVFLWIIKLFDFSGPKLKAAQKRIDNIKTVSAAHDELHSQGIAATDARMESLERLVEKFNDRYNALTHDMLSTGEMLAEIKKMTPFVQTLETSIHNRLEHLRHILTILPTDPKDDASFEANAQDMLKRPEKGTSKEIMREFDARFTTFKVQEVSHPLSIRIALERVAAGHNSLAEPMVPKVIMDHYAKLEEYMRQLTGLRIPPNVTCTQTTNQIVGKLTTRVLDDVMALKVYVSTVNIYSTERDRLLTALWEFVTASYQAAYTAGMADTDPEKRDVTKRVTARMKSRMK